MARGDGRLTHDLDPQDLGPQDACGVFGVWAPGEEVAKLTYFGLYALQHRGQESAGIAVSNGSQILVYKDMGLVSQAFDEATLASLRGHISIGHCRYSTTGSSVWANAQPTFRSTATGSIALGHNGNLTNTGELAASLNGSDDLDLGLDAEVEHAKANAKHSASSDTDILTSMLAGYPDLTIEQAAAKVLPKVKGAYSLIFMDENTLYAARDPQGIRPLVLGRLERGWVIASETAALDIVGASFIREVEPGEIVAIDAEGLRSTRFAEVRRGVWHPVRLGPGQERVRRPHLHPAEPDHPPARHPPQAEPAARGDRGQAAGGGRRHDRARQHPARGDPDAP